MALPSLDLLFDIPLLAAVAAFGILELQRRGFGPLGVVIEMVGVVLFAFQRFHAEPEGDSILAGLFTPVCGYDRRAARRRYLGATVMPCVI